MKKFTPEKHVEIQDEGRRPSDAPSAGREAKPNAEASSASSSAAMSAKNGGKQVMNHPLNPAAKIKAYIDDEIDLDEDDEDSVATEVLPDEDTVDYGPGGINNYEPSLTMHRMTVWELPQEENYSKAKKRPTLQDLMRGSLNNIADTDDDHEILAVKDEEQPDGGNKNAGKVVKFGWMEGVLLKCLLCIWGVMLFLRLSWVVGQSGILEGLAIITIANIIVGITGLSMSAVATNGRIEAGGVYYLISRSLGPELGGAIGLMFTLAQAISVATYTIGFCDNVLDLVYDQASGFHGIIDKDCKISDCRLNDLRVLGSPILFAILVLAIVGMDWVNRVDKILLLVLLAAQVDMFAGSLVQGGNLYVTEEERYSKGFTSWSLKTAEINTLHHYKQNGLKEESFMTVFGVFFTAVTGITAGANLSGDLKDPSEAIPKGTLIAIGWTYLSYIFFAIMVGFNYLPQASGDIEEWKRSTGRLDGLNDTTVLETDILGLFNEDNLTDSTISGAFGAAKTLAYDDCSLEAQAIRGGPCEFGAAVDQKTIMYISYTGWLVFFGCFAATLSSAIGSFVGAPRVLQAVGKDRLYPGITFFGKGRGINNDPVRGYFAVFAIAFGCLMFASLNTISTLASNFFLAAYALINFSVFHSSMTKSPGWRPSFKFYNPWLSLVGTIMATGAMIATDWKLAASTFAIVAFLYALTKYLKPEISWGSSAEALKFVNALTNTQDLNYIPDHVKTYRPKLLVMSGNPAHRQPLMDFANLLTKKLSLLISVNILTDKHETKNGLKNGNAGKRHFEDKSLASSGAIKALRLQSNQWMKDHKIKGFHSVVSQVDDMTEGVRRCIELIGLGKMCPNMILIGFNSNKNDINKLKDYVQVITNAFDNNLSVGMLRLPEGLDYSGRVAFEERVAVLSSNGGDNSSSDDDDDSTDDNESVVEADRNRPDAGGKQTRRRKRFRLPFAKCQPRPRRVSTYIGADGAPVPDHVVRSITQFRQRRGRRGNVDVWWLYDDGGLTMLLPHILKTRKQFRKCRLRVFSLSNNVEALDAESVSFARLLQKFRIDYAEVIVVPGMMDKARPETKAEFDQILAKFPSGAITKSDLVANSEKTSRNLRLTELVREHSAASELVVMTLPLPRLGLTNPALYMAYIDLLTRHLPPVLLTRGNQESVLTFHS